MPDSAPAVIVRRERVVIPTYVPAAPQKNPVFLENRVYQGSSGRVYPLPVIDRIADEPVPREWDVVYLENEYVRVMILPEIGGRIHAIEDKTNGYDLIYRQRVIKPALVGLGGPWLSGGIEFNWPQHHRPATYLRVDVAIEESADGAKTVWLGDHDPMQRMKGMHGVCLNPGRAVVELRVRAYNRTMLPQTFLWWANVATQVHEGYQSFFPPDVHYVADHAKRAMSRYPLCTGRYYGVNYGARPKVGLPPTERPSQFIPPYARSTRGGAGETSIPPYAPNDLSWYANIPVPTSYMAMGSKEDFFGGYDHVRRAGIIHIANHHIAPGKKQWTWGNSDFGYAWDRNLTTPDENGVYPPYIEIMAGVFTDNQPDFSFLQPGETKTWSQYWYPIREIGPAVQANVEAAISLQSAPAADGADRAGGAGIPALNSARGGNFPNATFAVRPDHQSGTRQAGERDRFFRIGLAVTRPHAAARLMVSARGRRLIDVKVDVAPGRPHLQMARLPRRIALDEVTVAVRDGATTLLRYEPSPRAKVAVPPPATAPKPPREIDSVDQLYLTGVHLDQYRHATRHPEFYWREALRRDAGDSRCNHALGAWHLRRGEFARAERHLRAAVARLTERNPNPEHGEPFYTLGVTLRYLDRDDEAYAAFYKATWSQAWQAAGFHALAEIDCTRGDWMAALAHLEAALRVNTDNLRARNLQTIVLRRLGRAGEAEAMLKASLALDPLDWWAQFLAGQPLRCDAQTRLDLAHDQIRAGLWDDALTVLSGVTPDANSGTAPLVAYTAAWLSHRRNDAVAERRWLNRAAQASPDYCFPARLEEFVILEWAVTRNPRDGRAPYYLGNFLYDRRRHEEAISAWETAVRLDPGYSVAWRNLGIAYYNIHRQPTRARRAYECALRGNPTDARLLFERDQLWKRLKVAPARRLQELQRYPRQIAERDDLALEVGQLCQLTGRPEKTVALLASRRFQPWEGGEGQALALHVDAHLALGQAALTRGDATEARRCFAAAREVPPNLGEARHPLANASNIHFWVGAAAAAAGDHATARAEWERAATFTGDFQEMAVREYSELTYYSALAWRRLGQKERGRGLLRELLAYARQLARTDATVDYFATSLPTMLLFNDDLRFRQETTALFLQAQAELGLGRAAAAKQHLAAVLRRDPSHGAASALARELRPGGVARHPARARRTSSS